MRPTSNKSIPFIRRPGFAFLSSMRFAVALLCILALASIIGTVLVQGLPATEYVIQFGTFWYPIFNFLGLYDVYSSAWFVLIMLFLVLSISLCLWRNIPPFLRQMKSFRVKTSAKSLSFMQHSHSLQHAPSIDAAMRYFKVSGFAVRLFRREQDTLISAKKGSANKWGYIFAHLAIIIICLGGLIDSNMFLKFDILRGKLVPDTQAVSADQFPEHSRLKSGTVSFRGNVNISEGQSADVVFLNTGQGFLMQDLPFSVKLNHFTVDYYDNGMPRDFASEVTITDKVTGRTFDKTIRVNHPFSLHGVTIYQASFGDGGSKLQFNAWDLASASHNSEPLESVSQSSYPLKLNGHDYRIEFGEFKPINVESIESHAQVASWSERFHDVRSVKQDSNLHNVGPSITYTIRDAAGVAYNYFQYMLPLEREGAQFVAIGEKEALSPDYRWLMIPVDSQQSIDTFMRFREVLLNKNERERLSFAAAKGMGKNAGSQERLGKLMARILEIFSEGGYPALEEAIRRNTPEAEQDRIRDLFLNTLLSGTSYILSEISHEQGLSAKDLAAESRLTFITNLLDGYTGLTRFHAPILLQLTGFNEVRSSGLQMTRSPGTSLVYLGSLLLVLGTIFMFYIREKRAWLLYINDKTLFAMAANRHARDLNHEFPEHVEKLEQLGQDLPHETTD